MSKLVGSLNFFSKFFSEMKMHPFYLLLGILLVSSQLKAQLLINLPVRVKDSLKVDRILEYRVDDFICTDTTLTVNKLDSLARVKKQTTYFKGKLQKEIEYFEFQSSTLFEMSIVKSFPNLSTTKSKVLIHFYKYDDYGNIIIETVKSQSDSIVRQTKFDFNNDQTISQIEYIELPKNSLEQTVNAKIDTFHYFPAENLVKRIRKLPSGKTKVKSEFPISPEEVKPQKKGDREFEFIGNFNKSKTRTLYRFDKFGNVISVEGYASYVDKEGGFQKETKLYTVIREIIYR